MHADDPTRLLHTLDLSRETLGYIAAHTREELDSNGLLYHAIKDCLSTIGEAAYKITRDFRDTHPEVDWRSLIRLRNELIHDYFVIDKDELWSTAEDYLPLLIPKLEALCLEDPRYRPNNPG